jgi:hypothetical protein
LADIKVIVFFQQPTTFFLNKNEKKMEDIEVIVLLFHAPAGTRSLRFFTLGYTKRCTPKGVKKNNCDRNTNCIEKAYQSF